MFTLTGVLLGFASSIVTELITWLNKKLFGTVFQGNAAMILAALFALIAGVVQQFWINGVAFSWIGLGQAFVVAYGFSQIWFQTIMSWLPLQVKQDSQSVAG